MLCPHKRVRGSSVGLERGARRTGGNGDCRHPALLKPSRFPVPDELNYQPKESFTFSRSTACLALRMRSVSQGGASSMYFSKAGSASS